MFIAYWILTVISFVLTVLPIQVSAKENAHPTLQKVLFSQLQGWENHPHNEALLVFRKSCQAMQNKRTKWPQPKDIYHVDTKKWNTQWKILCRQANTINDDHKNIKAQRFFENNFTPFIVLTEKKKNNALFTGYYEPIFKGSRKKSGAFQFPVYAKPHDLIKLNQKQQKQIEKNYGIKTQFGRIVDGHPKPYFSRYEIDQGKLNPYHIEILWLKDPMDVFFLQVQGSGRIIIENGEEITLAFAAKNGLPYYAIGRTLIKNGAIKRDKISMQAIRQWAKKNPKKVMPLLWENPSYVFFREVKADKNTSPSGAQNIPLTPKISLAIDPQYHAYGIPLWVQTYVKNAQGKTADFDQLMIAQDTGSAIKGAARGDVFWGRGKKAEENAGHMAGYGKLFVLIPKNTLK